ncbi:MAG: hypothetical protein CL947_01730 [Epsilonproteobacteria bacterium]|nr:hypothetical protein [Campylobacterota bacterium]
MKSHIVMFLGLLAGVIILDAAILQKEYTPGQKVRLQLTSVQNDTDSLEFKVFSAGQTLAGFATPMSTLDLIDTDKQGVDLAYKDTLVVKCSKGSYLPVFLKDGHKASGQAPTGYDGPYYISMWLPRPHVSDSSKLHIRYAVKKGKIGKVGLKIGMKGDYRLVAHENVQFLS